MRAVGVVQSSIKSSLIIISLLSNKVLRYHWKYAIKLVSKFNFCSKNKLCDWISLILHKYPKHHVIETNAYSVPGICNILNFDWWKWSKNSSKNYKMWLRVVSSNKGIYNWWVGVISSFRITTIYHNS